MAKRENRGAKAKLKRQLRLQAGIQVDFDIAVLQLAHPLHVIEEFADLIPAHPVKGRANLYNKVVVAGGDRSTTVAVQASHGAVPSPQIVSSVAHVEHAVRYDQQLDGVTVGSQRLGNDAVDEMTDNPVGGTDGTRAAQEPNPATTVVAPFPRQASAATVPGPHIAGAIAHVEHAVVYTQQLVGVGVVTQWLGNAAVDEMTDNAVGRTDGTCAAQEPDAAAAVVNRFAGARRAIAVPGPHVVGAVEDTEHATRRAQKSRGVDTSRNRLGNQTVDEVIDEAVGCTDGTCAAQEPDAAAAVVNRLPGVCRGATRD